MNEIIRKIKENNRFFEDIALVAVLVIGIFFVFLIVSNNDRIQTLENEIDQIKRIEYENDKKIGKLEKIINFSENKENPHNNEIYN
jgi:hypothetical protein